MGKGLACCATYLQLARFAAHKRSSETISLSFKIFIFGRTITGLFSFYIPGSERPGTGFQSEPELEASVSIISESETESGY